MNRIGKLFRALGMIVKQPSLLNHVLDDNDAWRRRVLKDFPEPEGLPRTDLARLIDLGQAKASPFAFLDGGSLPTDIILLKGLARKFPSCSYLEIGTWRGESVANVAEVAAECFTIDLPEEELRALGKDEDYMAMYAYFSKSIKNVRHIRQNTASFDFQSLGKKFDLIFVDGDHHYESVKRDTEKVFGLRKDEHSLVVWHDYAFSPEAVRWEVLAGILDGLPEGERKNLYHVSNTLCCVYSNAPLEAQKGGPNKKPGRVFEVSVTSSPK